MLLDVKIPHGKLSGLEREIAALTRLGHPNIQRVVDFSLDGDEPYIASTHIEGASLCKRLEECGCVNVSEAARIVDQILSGVGAAHKQGILHRDLKPENIILSAQGDVKVCDFGLAGIVTEGMSGSMSFSKSGIVGTFDYIAPEIKEGKPAVVESDLYAVGVVFYEMLTGRKLQSVGLHAQGILERAIMPQESVAVSYGARMADGVTKVLLKATAVEPEERYRSAEAFRKALRRALGQGAADIDDAPSDKEFIKEACGLLEEKLARVRPRAYLYGIDAAQLTVDETLRRLDIHEVDDYARVAHIDGKDVLKVYGGKSPFRVIAERVMRGMYHGAYATASAGLHCLEWMVDTVGDGADTVYKKVMARRAQMRQAEGAREGKENVPDGKIWGIIRQDDKKNYPKEIIPLALADEMGLKGAERARAKEAATELAVLERNFDEKQRGRIVPAPASLENIMKIDEAICEASERSAEGGETPAELARRERSGVREDMLRRVGEDVFRLTAAEIQRLRDLREGRKHTPTIADMAREELKQKSSVGNAETTYQRETSFAEPCGSELKGQFAPATAQTLEDTLRTLRKQTLDRACARGDMPYSTTWKPEIDFEQMGYTSSATALRENLAKMRKAYGFESTLSSREDFFQRVLDTTLPIITRDPERAKEFVMRIEMGAKLDMILRDAQGDAPRSWEELLFHQLIVKKRYYADATSEKLRYFRLVDEIPGFSQSSFKSLQSCYGNNDPPEERDAFTMMLTHCLRSVQHGGNPLISSGERHPHDDYGFALGLLKEDEGVIDQFCRGIELESLNGYGNGKDPHNIGLAPYLRSFDELASGAVCKIVRQYTEIPEKREVIKRVRGVLNVDPCSGTEHYERPSYERAMPALGNFHLFDRWKQLVKHTLYWDRTGKRPEGFVAPADAYPTGRKQFDEIAVIAYNALRRELYVASTANDLAPAEIEMHAQSMHLFERIDMMLSVCPHDPRSKEFPFTSVTKQFLGHVRDSFSLWVQEAQNPAK